MDIIANRVMQWKVAAKSTSDDYVYEKRISFPYLRNGVCARSVAELHAPNAGNDDISDDDLIEYIRFYRVFLFSDENSCSDEWKKYFYVSSAPRDEVSALMLSKNISQKKWSAIPGGGKIAEMQFDSSVTESQKQCLIREGELLSFSSVEYKSVQNSKHGRVLIESCKTENTRVILEFSFGEDLKIQFRAVPREVIEG